MFYSTKFTDSEIQQFKEQTDQKNRALNYNNIDKDIKTRWIGVVCEAAFERWLKWKKLEYTYWPTKDKIDELDFTVGQYNIDVKGVGTNYYPKPNYACNLCENQYKKLLRPDNKINALVHARFILPTNTVVLLGFISREKTIEKARFFKKGEKCGVIYLSSNNYEVPISELQDLTNIFVPSEVIC